MSVGTGQTTSEKSVWSVGPPIPPSAVEVVRARISDRALVQRLQTLEIRVSMERSSNLFCSSNSNRLRPLVAEEPPVPP